MNLFETTTPKLEKRKNGLYLSSRITNMPKTTYVLEVVRFITDSEEWKAKHGKQEHIRYMRAKFKKK